MYKNKILAITVSTMVLSSFNSDASNISEADAKKILSLSLSELSNITITSVSKKEEPENEAPAAIFVITQEDIKRSGALTIPEALRGAPGITVTQSGSNNWTVTSRGFNSQFANKLLVLIDGRTIYSPLFSGVVWDSQDTMMEDIERIEVIRGPGATLWGANAVNGVINIITKQAKDTQGGLAVATYGNKAASGAIRQGVKIGEDSYLRAYAKHNDYASHYNTDGSDAGDSWRKQQAGFRADAKLSDNDKLNIQGDIYTTDEDDSFIYPDLTSGTYANSSKGYKLNGGNLLMRWDQKQSEKSNTSLQVYYDRAAQKTRFFNDIANTFDLEFQHAWSGLKGQELIWGGGYRLINDNNDASAQYALTPDSRNDDIFSAFIQDKFTIIPERVFFTLGSKFEHNDYTGFEVQPSVRMSWLPDKNQTLWWSISRAVHTPSRFNYDGRLSYAIIPPSMSLPAPVLLTAAGNSDLDSEELIAYEIGYRIKPAKNLNIDLTAFYNDYDKLYSDSFGTTVVTSYVTRPILTVNSNEAKSVGFESAVQYNVFPEWQLSGSYSYISLVFDDKSKIIQTLVGKHPKNMFNLRSTYLFQNGLEMTNSLYSVSELSSVDIDGYVRFDTKFSYPITDSLDLSVVGQNLLDKRHKEFTPFLYQTQTEIGRSVYGSLAFKF